MEEMENYSDEEIGFIEQELLGAGAGTNINIAGLLRFFTENKKLLAAGAALVVLALMLPGLSRKPEETGPEKVLEGFDYFAAVQEKEGGEDNLFIAGELTETTEEPVKQQEEKMVTAAYYPTQSIQSAFPEDSLVQIGSKVYQLPVAVSVLEADGIHVEQVGAKVPKEDVLLNQMERSGIISVDGNRYTVDFINKQPCSYHELYVAGILDEGKNDAVLYAFSGIHVGSSEALLPDNWTDFKINDLAALNYYCYGDKEELGKKGVYAYIKTRAGSIVSVYIRDDRLE